MSKNLTPKRERFVHEYLATGNASEAYRRVYSVSGMNDASIKTEAHHVLHDEKVQARLREVQQAIAERAAITQEEVAERFRRAYTMAEEERQAAAMSQAASGLARMAGLFTDKQVIEEKREDMPPLPKLPPELEYIREEHQKREAYEAEMLTPENIIKAVKRSPDAAKALAEWEQGLAPDGKPTLESILDECDERGPKNRLLCEIEKIQHSGLRER